VVLTHAHDDHVSGLVEVLRRYVGKCKMLCKSELRGFQQLGNVKVKGLECYKVGFCHDACSYIL